MMLNTRHRHFIYRHSSAAIVAVLFALLQTGCATPTQRLIGSETAPRAQREQMAQMCAFIASASAESEIWKEKSQERVDKLKSDLADEKIGNRPTAGFLMFGLPVLDFDGNPVTYRLQKGDANSRAYVACMLGMGFKWEEMK